MPACRQCRRPIRPAMLTFQAQGTGYCNRCASQRVMLAESKPEAKHWLRAWWEKMESCLAVLKGKR